MAELTMRDKIAAAMYGPISAGRGTIAECWASADEPTRDYWRERTDAALGAMREPSPEMEAAFYAACGERGDVLWRYGYRAIIDAAQSEPPAA